MSWMLRVHSCEGGGESTFVLAPITRKRPWKTVALDGAGRACRRALMLEDGQVLPATGAVAMAYETAEGKSHRRDEVVTCDTAGSPLPLLTPTRDRPQPLEPAVPEDLLEYTMTATYAAMPERLGSELEQGLRLGQIFRTRFRARATTHERPAFLLASRGGIFLLLGERLEFSPCVREIPLPPEDDDELRNDEFLDDEDAWLRTDSLVSAGAPMGHPGDSDGIYPMDFNEWATGPGGEAC